MQVPNWNSNLLHNEFNYTLEAFQFKLITMVSCSTKPDLFEVHNDKRFKFCLNWNFTSMANCLCNWCRGPCGKKVGLLLTSSEWAIMVVDPKPHHPVLRGWQLLTKRERSWLRKTQLKSLLNSWPAETMRQ